MNIIEFVPITLALRVKRRAHWPASVRATASRPLQLQIWGYGAGRQLRHIVIKLTDFLLHASTI